MTLAEMKTQFTIHSLINLLKLTIYLCTGATHTRRQQYHWQQHHPEIVYDHSEFENSR